MSKHMSFLNSYDDDDDDILHLELCSLLSVLNRAQRFIPLTEITSLLTDLTEWASPHISTRVYETCSE
jgi:hypothetical protein